jgi:hypothetical protein
VPGLPREGGPSRRDRRTTAPTRPRPRRHQPDPRHRGPELRHHRDRVAARHGRWFGSSRCARLARSDRSGRAHIRTPDDSARPDREPARHRDPGDAGVAYPDGPAQRISRTRAVGNGRPARLRGSAGSPDGTPRRRRAVQGSGPGRRWSRQATAEPDPGAAHSDQDARRSDPPADQDARRSDPPADQSARRSRGLRRFVGSPLHTTQGEARPPQEGRRGSARQEEGGPSRRDGRSRHQGGPRREQGGPSREQGGSSRYEGRESRRPAGDSRESAQTPQDGTSVAKESRPAIAPPRAGGIGRPESASRRVAMVLPEPQGTIVIEAASSGWPQV